jgi:hypothetical protein
MNRHIRHRQEQGQDGDGQYEERGIFVQNVVLNLVRVRDEQGALKR